MRKLILKNSQSPGDILMLTAALRDLHRCCPGQFVTDVRTPCPALWENNPYITRLKEADKSVEAIDCHYPLIHKSNHAPWHFLHGFTYFLADQLQVKIQPSEFRGDIHLSDQEKSWISQVNELVGAKVPFWIIVAGGKYDYTIKWWDVKRYQDVVNQLSDKVLFVQVGERRHYQPVLENVIDLRGQTTLRQLVRLVYHAQGVLCPVTFLMHLAAAVPVKGSKPKNRPCVVVAGGREPPHWEAYPHHQFIHTVGALRCCDNGGCWKARTKPLGDGDKKDQPENLCVDVAGDLPRCMDMITADEVVRRVERYFEGGAVLPLQTHEWERGRAAIERLRARSAAAD
jgi:ADP-heptose:LPS heptosyltransferase